MDGTILVQSLDKYDETLHYLDVADQNEFIRAVVGWVPLADPSANAKALDALKARKKFVGMRHLIVYEKDPRWLLQLQVQESLEQLRKARTGVRGDHQHRGADGYGARHRSRRCRT
jgi:L-fuconolactonase